MNKSRLEAFSDGVLAIAITIMVLELKVPKGAAWADFRPILPILAVYLLSFLMLGTYWSNHHHMIHTVRRVNGAILWANLHLLFWLSLFPFVTFWMGQTSLASVPTAVYGIDSFMAAIAYTILQEQIIRSQGPDSKLKRAVGNNLKGFISLGLYLSAIGFAFVSTWLSAACFLLSCLQWLVPDRNIERLLSED